MKNKKEKQMMNVSRMCLVLVGCPNKKVQRILKGNFGFFSFFAEP